MFIVEARSTRDQVGTYSMKLVCVRNVQAGPVFEFWGQSNRKKAAVFPERSTAESAAVKTINEINKRWEGIQTYEFRVLPNKE